MQIFKECGLALQCENQFRVFCGGVWLSLDCSTWRPLNIGSLSLSVVRIWYFCKTYHGAKSKNWVIYGWSGERQAGDEDRTANDRLPTVEDINSYWQDSQFIIQHYICLIAHHSWQQVICLFVSCRALTEAFINSRQFCSVFLVSCCRPLQRAFLSPQCICNRISPSHSCVPHFWKDLGSFCQKRSWFTGLRSRRL